MLLAEWLIKIILNNIRYYLIHFAACWFKVPPMKSKNTVYFLYMCVCVFDSPLSGSSHWGWLPLRSSSSGRSALGFPSRHIPARCLWTRRRTCWSGSSGTEEALQKHNKNQPITICCYCSAPLPAVVYSLHFTSGLSFTLTSFCSRPHLITN